MQTKREIQQQVIANLVNVYTHTRDAVLEGAEPQQPYADPSAPVWGEEELRTAYAAAASMFIYYALETERRYGVTFLEHLQEQALLLAADELEDE